MALLKMILQITIALVVVDTGLAKSAVVKAEVRKNTNVQDPVEGYLNCYRVFMDRAVGTTYQEMCTAWKKLGVCKQRIKAVFPRVEDRVILGDAGVQEFAAKYWCNYKPLKYMPPARALLHKYHQCPYTNNDFLVLAEDYSAPESLASDRAAFAGSIQALVNEPSLTRWRPQSNYSDPADPVYQALASRVCAVHQYIQYRTRIVDKYCFLWGIYRDFMGKQEYYAYQHLYGLYNWDPSMCPPHPQDPVEKVLNIVQLETYLRRQVNSLDQCHASNVAVKGGSCIIMFHTLVPPYTDLHLFMPGFCEPIKELHQCWKQIVEMCPKQSANSDMDVLIKLHQLACDLSQQDLSEVWDIVYKWSGAVKNVEGSQIMMQTLATFMNKISEQPLPSPWKLVLPFASTLNMTLTTQPHITPQLQSLLQQVAFYLDRINLLFIDRYQGLSILSGLHNINHMMAGTISAALSSLVELFLTEGGFLDYDPKKLWPWKN